MSRKILIIDDDADMRQTLARALAQEGFAVAQSADGANLSSLMEDGVGLVLLDLNLGAESGFDIAKRLRPAYPTVGLIMLTGRADLIDKVVGLEIGADDYVSKPFDLRELLARIRSVLRRATAVAPQPNGEETLKFEGWCLDVRRRKLTSPDGQEVSLTTTEFSVLKLLAETPGQPVSRQALYEVVRSRDWSPLERTLDTHIANIRRKLQTTQGGRRGLITTVQGVGYVLASHGKDG